MLSDQASPVSRDAPRSRSRQMLELVVLITLALFLVLAFQAYAVKPYKIPSGSMEPTLRVGDRIVVDRFSHRVLGATPRVGDVVVFHPPRGADARPARCGDRRPDSERPCDRATPGRSSQSFVKRVVAVGGDRIVVRDGRVIRNDKLQHEPFTAPCQPGGGCYFTHAIKVPRGHFYLMGDNRGHSEDSRFWGPVPRSWIIGKVVATAWPPGRVGGL